MRQVNQQIETVMYHILCALYPEQTGKTKASCEDNTDCPSGVCVAKICLPDVCRRDKHCANPGDVCRNKACVPGRMGWR